MVSNYIHVTPEVIPIDVLSISATLKWIAINFNTDIHSALTINFDEFYDFSPSATSRSVFMISLYYSTLSSQHGLQSD